MPQADENPVTIVLFLDVIAELNKSQKRTQKAFYEFVRKLRTDPSLLGLHVELPTGMKDKGMRSVRITRSCRAVIFRKDRTNIYTILHLDEGHDDAYDWISRHQVTTDMLTNTVRLEDAPSSAQLAQLLADGASVGAHTDLLAPFSDDDLIEFGVPANGVSVLRRAPSKPVAKIMTHLLPEQAQMYVDFALDGYKKEEIAGLLADDRKQSPSYGFTQTESSQQFIDAAGDNQAERDARTMLTSNGTQQQFVVLTDDEDLERLMNAPLAQWRVFLHPTQRSVVDGNYSGPARVTGGAGTGKTVVAMHRARRLAQSLLQQGSDRKVLLTTFTANLANDILSNMKLLCSEKELAHIGVINLDKWLYPFVYRNTKFRVQYNTDDLWEEAKSASSDESVSKLPVDFFIREWEQVILANNVTCLDEYLAVPRRGRGERLVKAQREAVWEVAERYLQLMDEHKEYDQPYAMHVAAKLLDGPQATQKFAFVVVDEGQDFGASAYRLLRSMVDRHANDIFIAGDNHQQLYGNRVSLKQCGIPIAGRSFRLKVNYRTTNEIKTVAETVCRVSGANTVDGIMQAVKDAKNNGRQVSDFSRKKPDELDYSLTGVFDDSAQEESFGDGVSLTHGEWPEALRCKSWNAQFRCVTDWIDKRLSQDSMAKPEGICVIVRDNQHVDDWVDALNSKSTYKALKLDNKTKEVTSKSGIRVATMHRAKGLEFDYVVVPDVDQCPPPSQVRKCVGDSVKLNQLYRQERNLLYVAMTRPRKELLVTAVVANG
ncbi:UvrD-like helicase C-terminal domain-containing protein [Bifidobacterium ramosum]|uniref:DNA 3'-5' helicase n=1 Tax=Bifidobacterium ramosum TaxID=1798158 RepID=A0A6L4WYE3_9BIFI|nr:UvrD-helicase domain-containing protein [Bifidobacterium ramosum]KAB8287091.1 UvrD-like helicase C-terminal domain-containing protein [Bifidobacterium ramosum]NEG71844.1 AAA family ATPase [Bifidobacterium ramosum]